MNNLKNFSKKIVRVNCSDCIHCVAGIRCSFLEKKNIYTGKNIENDLEYIRMKKCGEIGKYFRVKKLYNFTS